MRELILPCFDKLFSFVNDIFDEQFSFVPGKLLICITEVSNSISVYYSFET